MINLNDIKNHAVRISQTSEFHDGLEITKAAMKGVAIGGGIVMLAGVVAGIKVSASPFIIGGAVIGATRKYYKMKGINQEFSELLIEYSMKKQEV